MPHQTAQFLPPRTDAPHWQFDETQVSAYVAEKIRAGSRHESPAPYLYIENVLPQDFYTAILRASDASDALFKEQIHRGDPRIFFGSYSDRLEFKVPADTATLPVELSGFWESVKTVLGSPTVFSAMRNRFEDGFQYRFGPTASDSDLRQQFRSSLLVTRHRSNYYLGPHTDRTEKVITCILNCAESDGLDHLGTAMYTPKQEGFTCNGWVHHDPTLFNHTHTVPFRPNSMLLFFRDDRLFHGVNKLSDESLLGSRRANVQFNYWKD